MLYTKAYFFNVCVRHGCLEAKCLRVFQFTRTALASIVIWPCLRLNNCFSLPCRYICCGNSILTPNAFAFVFLYVTSCCVVVVAMIKIVSCPALIKTPWSWCLCGVLGYHTTELDTIPPGRARIFPIAFKGGKSTQISLQISTETRQVWEMILMTKILRHRLLNHVKSHKSLPFKKATF